ncbi:MAG: hypothetical protein ACKPEY_21345 [Planctomycetota bacterium]
MICTKCEKDCRLSERPKGVCPHCFQRFVFEPADKPRDPITDRLFLNAVNTVSSEGSVRWTIDSLYYEICRRKKVNWFQVLIGLFYFNGVFLICVTSLVVAKTPRFVPYIVTLAVFLAFGISCYYIGRLRYVRLSRQIFQELYDRWEALRGPPPGVIERRMTPITEAAVQVEDDVADYSFDRAVICDRRETADLLLANDFHFENNCAVLSIDGYPQRLFDTVRQMLRRNPKLKVYAIHDATVGGCQMAENIATDAAWFGGGVPVIDVGLRPSHARRMKGLWHPASDQQQPATSGITVREAKWLKRHRLELAAIPPEQLIKRLYRAMSQEIDTSRPEPRVIYLADRWLSKSERTVADGGDVFSDGGPSSFAHPATDMEGLSDSFG